MNSFEEGWFEESSLLTNFDADEKNEYEKAISEYKNKYGYEPAYIKDIAYDCYGNLLPDTYSLHWTGQSNDMTEFWEMFDRIKVA